MTTHHEPFQACLRWPRMSTPLPAFRNMHRFVGYIVASLELVDWMRCSGWTAWNLLDFVSCLGKDLALGDLLFSVTGLVQQRATYSDHIRIWSSSCLGSYHTCLSPYAIM